MSRGIGGIDAVRDILPDELVPVFVVITHLGSTTFYVVALSVLYWVDTDFLDRKKVGFVISMAVIGGGCVVLFKGIFELPRPPQELWLVETDGYGFPSGHALSSTVVWGSLALVWDKKNVLKSGTVASIPIFLISFSRVFLGVHYAVDVVSGVLAGIGILALGYWIGMKAGERNNEEVYGTYDMFGLAVLVGIGAIAVTGGGFYSVFFAGIGAGGFLVSRFTEALETRTPKLRSKTVLIVAGLPFAGGTYYLASEISFSMLVLVTGFALASGVLYLPVATEKVEKLVSLDS